MNQKLLNCRLWFSHGEQTDFTVKKVASLYFLVVMLRDSWYSALEQLVCFGHGGKEIRMRLLFKQRFFSWLDSYDIYDESGNIAYVVKGQLSWGHCLKVYDAMGQEAGLLQERIFTWLPKFEIYTGGQYRGCIRKELSLFTPRYVFDCCGWQVEGNFMEWDYTIRSGNRQVASVSKELFNWTDTYVLDIADPADALLVLLFVLAVDAEKCSRSSH